MEVTLSTTVYVFVRKLNHRYFCPHDQTTWTHYELHDSHIVITQLTQKTTRKIMFLISDVLDQIYVQHKYDNFKCAWRMKAKDPRFFFYTGKDTNNS